MLANRDPWKVTLAVVAGVIVLACGGGTTSEPPGQTLAAVACATFADAVRSAVDGTITSAGASKAVGDAQKKADAAAALNVAYKPLLVMLTSAVNNSDPDGDLANRILGECSRLGLL